MNTNNRGFSVVEGLLIIVIISLLSLAGWFVWSSDNKTKQSSSSPEVSGAVNKNSFTEQPTVEVPSGWAMYQSKKLGVSFAYPKDWTFRNKSKELTSTRSYYIGELTSEDKTTTIEIILKRKVDGRNTRSSINEWRAYATNSNIQYSNLTEIKSSYVAFSYIMDVSGAKGLVYQVLESDNNIEVLVLPVETNQKVTIEQLINTLRFE